MSQWELDDQATHDIADLKVLLRTVGMGIMTGHTSLADSQIGIYRVKVGVIIDLDCPSDSLFRSCNQSFEATPIRLIARTIFWVNGPKTDQSVTEANEFRRKHVAGFGDKLNW
jgi:hypothetical protein